MLHLAPLLLQAPPPPSLFYTWLSFSFYSHICFLAASCIFLSFNNGKHFFCWLIQLNSLKFHYPLWQTNGFPFVNSANLRQLSYSSENTVGIHYPALFVETHHELHIYFVITVRSIKSRHHDICYKQNVIFGTVVHKTLSFDSIKFQAVLSLWYKSPVAGKAHPLMLWKTMATLWTSWEAYKLHKMFLATSRCNSSLVKICSSKKQGRSYDQIIFTLACNCLWVAQCKPEVCPDCVLELTGQSPLAEGLSPNMTEDDQFSRPAEAGLITVHRYRGSTEDYEKTGYKIEV